MAVLLTVCKIFPYIEVENHYFTISILTVDP